MPRRYCSAAVVSASRRFLVFRRTARRRPIRSADSDSRCLAILKLNAKPPIARANLKRHSYGPCGCRLGADSKIVCAMLPVGRQDFRVRSANVYCFVNAKQRAPVGSIAPGSAEDLGEPEAPHPDENEKDSEEGGNGIRPLDSHRVMPRRQPTDSAACRAPRPGAASACQRRWPAGRAPAWPESSTSGQP
jgi:hypothetical protein